MISAMAVPSFMAVPSPKLADVELGLVRDSWNRDSSIGKACAPPLQGNSDMHLDDPANIAVNRAPDAAQRHKRVHARLRRAIAVRC